MMLFFVPAPRRLHEGKIAAARSNRFLLPPLGENPFVFYLLFLEEEIFLIFIRVRIVNRGQRSGFAVRLGICLLPRVKGFSSGSIEYLFKKIKYSTEIKKMQGRKAKLIN